MCLLNGVALSVGCGGIDKMIRGRRKVGGGSLVEGSNGRGTFYASISFCLDPILPPYFGFREDSRDDLIPQLKTTKTTFLTSLPCSTPHFLSKPELI